MSIDSSSQTTYCSKSLCKLINSRFYWQYSFLLVIRGNEKIAARRASERREQLRAVQAHVRKDDGRLHAYGWSLPAKGTGPAGESTPPKTQQTSATPQVPVPVPVYCRPLMEKEDGMKVSSVLYLIP